MVLDDRESGQGIYPARAVAAAPDPAGWQLESAEGKLAVDIAETPTHVLVVSTIAGASLRDIEVYLHNDLLTIRGERRCPIGSLPGATYIYQECFWGKFSRTVVLPTHVKAELASAEYKYGVLTISVPKRTTDTRIAVRIVEE